jgi:hypothetical protein
MRRPACMFWLLLRGCMTSLYLSTETTVIGLDGKRIENHRSNTTQAANPRKRGGQKKRTALRFSRKQTQERCASPLSRTRRKRRRRCRRKSRRCARRGTTGGGSLSWCRNAIRSRGSQTRRHQRPCPIKECPRCARDLPHRRTTKPQQRERATRTAETIRPNVKTCPGMMKEDRSQRPK